MSLPTCPRWDKSQYLSGLHGCDAYNLFKSSPMATSTSVGADPSYPPLISGTTALPPPLPGKFPLKVPVIDLGNLEHGQLGEACQRFGLFRLINHGLPQEVSLRLRAEVRRIFELPFNRKRMDMSGPGRGRPAIYFWGTPALSLSLRSVNWLEGIQVPLAVFVNGDCGRRSVDNGCCSDYLRRTLVEEYGKHMIRIVRTLFDSLAVHLKLDTSLSESYVDASDGIFRAYRYPCLPESQSLMGMEAHTDSSVLTVIDQDDAGGLQIRRENAWFDVVPAAGTLIINIGDMMQAISSDECRSVEHRVLASGRKERISLCFFAFPKEDFKIRSSNYREFTYREFKARVEEDIKETGDKVGLKRFLL